MQFSFVQMRIQSIIIDVEQLFNICVSVMKVIVMNLHDFVEENVKL